MLKRVIEIIILKFKGLQFFSVNGYCKIQSVVLPFYSSRSRHLSIKSLQTYLKIK